MKKLLDFRSNNNIDRTNSTPIGNYHEGFINHKLVLGLEWTILYYDGDELNLVNIDTNPDIDKNNIDDSIKFSIGNENDEGLWNRYKSDRKGLLIINNDPQPIPKEEEVKKMIKKIGISYSPYKKQLPLCIQYKGEYLCQNVPTFDPLFRNIPDAHLISPIKLPINVVIKDESCVGFGIVLDKNNDNIFTNDSYNKKITPIKIGMGVSGWTYNKQYITKEMLNKLNHPITLMKGPESRYTIICDPSDIDSIKCWHKNHLKNNDIKDKNEYSNLIPGLSLTVAKLSKFASKIIQTKKILPKHDEIFVQRGLKLYAKPKRINIKAIDTTLHKKITIIGSNGKNDPEIDIFRGLTGDKTRYGIFDSKLEELIENTQNSFETMYKHENSPLKKSYYYSTSDIVYRNKLIEWHKEINDTLDRDLGQKPDDNSKLEYLKEKKEEYENLPTSKSNELNQEEDYHKTEKIEKNCYLSSDKPHYDQGLPGGRYLCDLKTKIIENKQKDETKLREQEDKDRQKIENDVIKNNRKREKMETERLRLSRLTDEEREKEDFTNQLKNDIKEIKKLLSINKKDNDKLEKDIKDNVRQQEKLNIDKGRLQDQQSAKIEEKEKLMAQLYDLDNQLSD